MFMTRKTLGKNVSFLELGRIVLALLFRPVSGEFFLNNLDLCVVIVPLGDNADGSV
jgi:hypothetical protein